MAKTGGRKAGPMPRDTDKTFKRKPSGNFDRERKQMDNAGKPETEGMRRIQKRK